MIQICYHHRIVTCPKHAITKNVKVAERERGELACWLLDPYVPMELLTLTSSQGSGCFAQRGMAVGEVTDAF